MIIFAMIFLITVCFYCLPSLFLQRLLLAVLETQEDKISIPYCLFLLLSRDEVTYNINSFLFKRTDAEEKQKLMNICGNRF